MIIRLFWQYLWYDSYRCNRLHCRGETFSYVYKDVIKDMYGSVIASIRFIGGEAITYLIIICLHQGPTLSGYLLL